MKLVSFAIPCYNSAAYMRKCIESILPGGDEVEIIVVDDGSQKDDTFEIAKEYEAKYPGIVKAVLPLVLMFLMFRGGRLRRRA